MSTNGWIQMTPTLFDLLLIMIFIVICALIPMGVVLRYVEMNPWLLPSQQSAQCSIRQIAAFFQSKHELCLTAHLLKILKANAFLLALLCIRKNQWDFSATMMVNGLLIKRNSAPPGGGCIVSTTGNGWVGCIPIRRLLWLQVFCFGNCSPIFFFKYTGKVYILKPHITYYEKACWEN